MNLAIKNLFAWLYLRVLIWDHEISTGFVLAEIPCQLLFNHAWKLKLCQMLLLWDFLAYCLNGLRILEGLTGKIGE